jgi:CubicO group peptidase (beta-lactamase class C family)
MNSQRSPRQASVCAVASASKPYEVALKELVLDPLGLKHSGFFTDELIGQNIAASHAVEKDRPVVTETWAFPRSLA